MRRRRACLDCLGVVAATVLLVSPGAASAQGWREFRSRDEFFMVSMPADPTVTETMYAAASGARLPAKVFRATDDGSVFSMTVVHYMNASADDVASAIEHAVETLRSRPGEVTYDRPVTMEGLPGHWIYLLNPDGSRTAAGIYLHAGPSEYGGPGRLYILEGNAPADRPSPINFSQTFMLLDQAGQRLDYVTDANGQRVRNMRGQRAGIGAAYGAREPAVCTSRSGPAQGKPTLAQAAQHLTCTTEGVADGSLYLLENVEVTAVDDGEAFDESYFPDIDTAHLVYPIRGSLVRYECRRERDNNVGTNCVSHVEVNASGYCYKTTAGNWDCNMADLVQQTTEGVAPPR